MAVTRTGQVIRLETGDSISDETLIIQGIYAEGATTITDGGTKEIADLGAGEFMSFPEQIVARNVTIGGTGPVFLYLR